MVLHGVSGIPRKYPKHLRMLMSGSDSDAKQRDAFSVVSLGEESHKIALRAVIRKLHAVSAKVKAFTANP